MAGPSTTLARRRARTDLLGINLNDHLAGATVGTELARRVAKAHQNGPDGSSLPPGSERVIRSRTAG